MKEPYSLEMTVKNFEMIQKSKVKVIQGFKKNTFGGTVYKTEIQSIEGKKERDHQNIPQVNGGLCGCVKEITSFHVHFMLKDGQRYLVQVLPGVAQVGCTKKTSFPQ